MNRQMLHNTCILPINAGKKSVEQRLNWFYTSKSNDIFSIYYKECNAKIDVNSLTVSNTNNYTETGSNVSQIDAIFHTFFKMVI